MKNRITIHLYLKESRTDSKGYSPVYLRLTVNGKRAEMSTGIKLLPSFWDRVSERASGRSEEARVINSRLISLLGRVNRHYSRLDATDERISIRQMISEIKGSGENQITLIQAYEAHIGQINLLVNVDYEPNTIKRYKSSMNGLKEFIKSRYGRYDIRLIDLDRSFIESYQTYLRVDRGLQHNTAAKDIKNLNRVLNRLVMNGTIPRNPFKGFSCSYVNPRRQYLSSEEIDLLYHKDFQVKRLARVRDVFLFQVYTGLAYSDISELSQDSIVTGIDGGKWIVIFRKKTGTRSSIPLLPRAQTILDRYKQDPYCQYHNLLIPVSSNQRMNGYLKEIADICQINKNLTTHLARHTFATTVTLSSGVPIETVSKMLGHSDLRTTQIYSKVIDKKVAEDMKHLISDLSANSTGT